MEEEEARAKERYSGERVERAHRRLRRAPKSPVRSIRVIYREPRGQWRSSHCLGLTKGKRAHLQVVHTVDTTSPLAREGSDGPLRGRVSLVSTDARDKGRKSRPSSSNRWAPC